MAIADGGNGGEADQAVVVVDGVEYWELHKVI